jgi:hypothetical protein
MRARRCRISRQVKMEALDKNGKLIAVQDGFGGGQRGGG